MYEMTVICLDGSKNAFVVCRSFYEMVYEMRETHRNKKWAGGGTEFLWGRKAWRVGLVGRGTSHFLLPPRYKVCMIEREGFNFLFFFYSFFIRKKASIRY